MSSSEFLNSFRVVEAPGQLPVVEGEISEAWGIRFAQGGIVMAAMLHAAELVFDRPDVRLATVASTFCRAVPCGPVAVEVAVVRNGRNGVQLQTELRRLGDDDRTPNAVATLVYTTRSPGWPELHGLRRPDALAALPSADRDHPRMGSEADGRPAGNFFEQTDWRVAREQPSDPLRRLGWFSFVDGPARRPDGSWVPSLLGVPGDALGMAIVAPVTDVMGRLTAPSLQISMQLYAPAVGDWLGIDSQCFSTQGSLASGLATLWNGDGSLVATVTQTAMLRRL